MVDAVQFAALAGCDGYVHTGIPHRKGTYAVLQLATGSALNWVLSISSFFISFIWYIASLSTSKESQLF